MNSFVVSRSGFGDLNASVLYAVFENTSGGTVVTAGRQCPNCVTTSGAYPSYAIVASPLKELLNGQNFDQYPGVALKTNGPAGVIKLLSKGSVFYKDGSGTSLLMNGTLTYHSFMFGEDSMLSAIFDDRWIMDKFLIFGKMWFDPNNNKHCFTSNPNDPLVFNKYGWPDCLDTPFGPRFPPPGSHRFGYSSTAFSESTDEPSEGTATRKCRKWTLRDICRYIVDFASATGQRPSLGQDFGDSRLPSTIKFVESFGAQIVENRSPQDFSLQYNTILKALDTTIRRGGPYDLTCEPVAGGGSLIGIADMTLRHSNAGATIYPPDAAESSEAALANPSIFRSGFAKASAVDYVDKVAVMGDAPVVGALFSTDTSTPSKSQDNSAHVLNGFIVPGWTGPRNDSQAAETAFKNQINRDGNDAKAFNFAISQNPEVYSTYCTNYLLNPFKDTKFGFMAQNGRLRVLSHQIRCRNPLDSSTLAMVPYDIYLEYKLTDWEYAKYLEFLSEDEEDVGEWRFFGKFHEYQLSPDGFYVKVAGLRDSKTPDNKYGSWVAERFVKYNEEGEPVDFPWRKGMSTEDVFQIAGEFDGLYMKRREIRMQMAVESEHAQVVIKEGTGDMNGAASMLSPDRPKFTLALGNPPLTYVHWEDLEQSHPIGWAQLTGVQKQAAANFHAKVLWEDSARQNSHAAVHLSNFNRIMWDCTYEIGRLTNVYKIGMQLTAKGPNVISGVTGIIKCISYSNDTNTTAIHAGPGEPTALYDGPLSMIADSGGSSGVPAPSDNSKVGKTKTDTSTGSGSTSTTGTGSSDTTYTTPTAPSKPAAPVEEESYNSSSSATFSLPQDSNGDIDLEKLRSQVSPDDLKEAQDALAKEQGSKGDSGSGGASGVKGVDPSIPRKGESMEDYGNRLKQSAMIEKIGQGMPQAKSSSQGKGTIRGPDELAQSDALKREVGQVELNKDGKQTIFSGASLARKDDEFMARQFEPGGIKDQFREKGREPGAFRSDGTKIQANSNSSQEQRAKDAFNVDVARGFNPTGAAPKPYKSSKDWNAEVALRTPVNPYGGRGAPGGVSSADWNAEQAKKAIDKGRSFR